MYLLWLAACIAVLAGIGVFILNALGIKYYMHTKETSLLACIVTLLGISISQLSIVIIPLDVYNASFSEPDTYEIINTTLMFGYYAIFLCVIALSCIFIPFSYFYAEATYIGDDDITVKQKIISAVKYTAVPIIIVIILLLVGLFLHTDHIADLIPTEEETGTEEEVKLFGRKLLQQVDYSSYNYSLATEDYSTEEEIIDANTANAYGYLEQILDSNVLEYSITFTYFVLTGAGFVTFWISYTAIGMSASAVLLLKGTKRLEGEIRDLQGDLETTQEKVTKLENKYPGKMPDKIRKEYDDAVYEIEQTQAKLEYLEGEQEDNWKNKLKNVAKPLVFVFGAILLVVYGLIMLSLLFTQIDRYRSSDCGWSCGFVITSPQLILNPLDMILTYSSQYFPLDIITFSLIVVFITIGTLSGILAFGIRFMWIKMFSVRPQKTIPQALVASALIIMLCSICLMIEILSIAPQYATFGARTYLDENGDTEWCNMSAGADACPMTQIAQIINRFYASISIAGIAFYFGTWLFIGMFIVGIAISVFISRSNVAASVTEEEELEDDL